MGHNIYIPQDIAQEGVRCLEVQGYQVQMGGNLDRQTLIRNLKNSDAVLLRTVVLDAEMIAAAAGRLKVIAKHGVGVDNIDLAAARQYGISVVNAPLSNANAVTEHALAMILALAKNLVSCDQAFRICGDFTLRYQYTNMDLEGKHLGIVGFGRIGKLLATKAKLGFKMQVAAYDPYFSGMPPVEMTMLTSLDELFTQSDFISLHFPLSDATRHLIDFNLFRQMKPSAFFINVARGELVVESDLIRALNQKIIAGAGLDVFEIEPTGPDLAFFKMNNVILSPHNAAFTSGALVRMAQDAALGIHEVLSGQQPTWPILSYILEDL